MIQEMPMKEFVFHDRQVEMVCLRAGRGDGDGKGCDWNGFKATRLVNRFD